MDVYLRDGNGTDLVGRTSLTEDQGDTYVVDIDIAGTCSALRLTYALETVIRRSEDGTGAAERAVILSLGQTPNFLPGWERVDDSKGFVDLVSWLGLRGERGRNPWHG